MRRLHQTRILLLALTLVGSRTPQDETDVSRLAKLGERVPEYEFTPISAHDGRASLSQLIGHPVIVAGWRQYIPEPSGLNAAWFSNTLMREFADDGLIVILRDRKPWDSKRWWMARSFWPRMFVSEVWFAAGEAEVVPDLPIVREKSAVNDQSMVLIGVDGTLLFEGTIEDAGENDLGKEVRALVKEEVARRKKGWGEDRDLKKARALAFWDAKYAKALAVVEKSEAPQEDVDQVRSEIERAFAAELASVRYLEECGRYLEAEDRWEALKKACKGHAAFTSQCDELAPRFEGAEAKRSRKLAKRAEKVLGLMIFEEWDDLDMDALFELRALAAEDSEHPVCRRAVRLDPLVKDLTRISLRLLPKGMREAIAKREEKEAGR